MPLVVVGVLPVVVEVPVVVVDVPFVIVEVPLVVVNVQLVVADVPPVAVKTTGGEQDQPETSTSVALTRVDEAMSQL